MKEIIRFSGERNPIHGEIQSYGLTCSFSRKELIDPMEFRKFARELMISIAQECFRYGAKEIGHVKAHLEHGTGFLSADTLGTPEDVMVEGRDGEPAGRFTVTVNSVVYGLDQKGVRTATEESLASVTSQFGFRRER